MTETEIILACAIVERHFGAEQSRLSRLMLETGEMPVKELYRRARQLTPRISKDLVRDTLHVFFQHDLLLLHTYETLIEDGPYVSFDFNRAFFILSEPIMCYAVEEIFGDEEARAVSILLAMGCVGAEKFIAEFENDAGVSAKRREYVVVFSSWKHWSFCWLID